MKSITQQFALASAFALLGSPAVSGEAAADTPVALDLNFAYHIEADMAEQDVFIERKSGSGRVFRPTKADRNHAQPIYASAQPQPHAPFDEHANGPFKKGRPLGLTLAQWYGASGSGTYRCTDGQGRLDVGFSGLVPNGVYTMWHFFMASPPTDPFIGTQDLPLGSRDGVDSVFAADGQGNARYTRTITPCLQLSGEQLMAGLAIAWHSDGMTYGGEPGAFGRDSHVQLFLGLPRRAGL